MSINPNLVGPASVPTQISTSATEKTSVTSQLQATSLSEKMPSTATVKQQLTQEAASNVGSQLKFDEVFSKLESHVTLQAFDHNLDEAIFLAKQLAPAFMHEQIDGLDHELTHALEMGMRGHELINEGKKLMEEAKAEVPRDVAKFKEGFDKRHEGKKLLRECQAQLKEGMALLKEYAKPETAPKLSMGKEEVLKGDTPAIDKKPLRNSTIEKERLDNENAHTEAKLAELKEKALENIKQKKPKELTVAEKEIAAQEKESAQKLKEKERILNEINSKIKPFEKKLGLDRQEVMEYHKAKELVNDFEGLELSTTGQLEINKAKAFIIAIDQKCKIPESPKRDDIFADISNLADFQAEVEATLDEGDSQGLEELRQVAKENGFKFKF